MLRQTSERKVAPTFEAKYLLDRIFPKRHQFEGLEINKARAGLFMDLSPALERVTATATCCICPL
jgi:hypothetical protein